MRSTFMIQINEHQRKLIATALGMALAGEAFEGRDLDEADLLTAMFETLPADDEACEDNTLHGFCL